jgi:hypothetical protein
MWSISPFCLVRSARILINNESRREVGNTGVTHSGDPGFKPTSSRQLFRMSFLRLLLHRRTKHNYKATCSGMLHRVHWLGFTSPHGVK